MDLDLPLYRKGVLPCQYLERAIDAKVIDAGRFTIPRENVQPASLDLRLGEVAYRIRCSFLPGSQSVERRVKDYIIDELDLRKDGAVLENKRPYLIPLKERLSLPPKVRGKANPKSSTGRIDVFTRVITDESYRFDEIAAGYDGPLYLEVVPLSFPVRVGWYFTRAAAFGAESTDASLSGPSEFGDCVSAVSTAKTLASRLT